MSGTTSNMDKWIVRSEPDYYIMFVKAWIPFNAWYMTNFYNEDEKRIHDRDIIYYVMTKSNWFRDRLHAYLTGHDDESESFRSRVAMLSQSLDSYPLPNVEDQLSFSRVCIENNPNARKTGNVKAGKYTCISKFDEKLPKSEARWILELLKNKGSHHISRFRCSRSKIFLWG